MFIGQLVKETLFQNRRESQAFVDWWFDYLRVFLRRGTLTELLLQLCII